MIREPFVGVRKLPAAPSPSYRRRPVTRRSGYRVGGELSGGELRIEKSRLFEVTPGAPLKIRFHVKGPQTGEWIGFGLWYWASQPPSVRCSATGAALTITPPGAPDNWSKLGSLFRSDGQDLDVEVEFPVSASGRVGIWGPNCGVVSDPLLKGAAEPLLGNMYQYAPEALKDVTGGTVTVEAVRELGDDPPVSCLIRLKACNRCSRYLPINYPAETVTLSFSNHCTAKPCVHSTFGELRPEDGQVLKLRHGFQLECRYCKKFTVNAAHNPQRTPGQMKEDAARRRAFELLLTELTGTSASLAYHEKFGRELVDDVWERFGGRCFNCGRALESKKKMHLDHTRPLALLWPLDETATALCANCNSAKHDRSPADFYTPEKLERLSAMVGLSLDQLQDPSPNVDMVRHLLGRREWLFSEFLSRPEFAREREGKQTPVLIVKALQRVIDQCPLGLIPEKEGIDLVKEYRLRKPHD